MRMKIWEFAVGGHVVECFYKGKNLRPSGWAYAVQHLRCKYEPCRGNRPSRLWKNFKDIFVNGLAAPICRQIRAEAAGLQFKTNIFFFDDKDVFDSFFDVLSKAQIGSMQEVSFPGDVWWFNPVHGTRNTAKVEVHSVLASLKRVYIHPHWPETEFKVPPNADLEVIREILETDPCWSFEDDAGIEVLVFDVFNQAASPKDVSQIFHL